MTHRLRAHRTDKIALLESLESRVLFSAGHMSVLAHRKTPAPRHPRGKGIPVPVAVTAPSTSVTPNATSFVGQGYTPAQIRHAYGFDQITFGSTVGDGTGQTIAIIDAYNDPNIIADLAAFDAAFGIAAPPNFSVIAQDGTTNLPPNAPKGGWAIEESLDVEWAHAMAPGANIILIEAQDNQTSNFNAAVLTARSLANVSVISMSFGSTENPLNENSTDNAIYSTPSGHSGITFVASTGDSGPPGEYPAFSKNVVAVGGTTLNLNSDSTISSETVWNGTGGGISVHEPLPDYQVGLVTQTSTARTTPDLAMDADPNTGVPVYDSYDLGASPWGKFGGTSVSAPLFSGLVAITDQGRALRGLSTLDGPTQTLPLLYSLPASDFNDITSGSSQQSNSTSNTTLTFSAAPGYDLVTGRGSPIANKVVFGLMGPAASVTASISGTLFQGTSSDSVVNGSGIPLANTTVYIDSDNNDIFDPAALATGSASPNLTIPGNSTTGVSSNITISGTTNTITNVTVNVNITHSNDSGLTLYLIAPNGTQIALSNGAGGSGSNFSNTTFSDFASTSINSGTAPFSNGTFRPTLDALADFDGFSANGVWKLRVAYNSFSSGVLNSWTLNITTGDPYSTTTDANGNYSFNNLLTNNPYTVRTIAPAGFAQSVDSVSFLTSNLTQQNIAILPPIFNSSNNTSSFYVHAVNSNNLQIFNSTSASGNTYFSVPLTAPLGLTFNLSGSNNSLTISFAEFSPIPLGNITLNATAASSESLTVIGHNTSQAFTLTNTSIGPTGGGLILFQNLPTLTLGTSTTTLTTDLNSLQNLNLNSDEFFNFG